MNLTELKLRTELTDDPLGHAVPYKPGNPYAYAMKEPESLPVEQARTKFADILDGTQHHSQHFRITRRGKSSFSA